MASTGGSNTGYKIQPRLKKVSDDGNNYPLDVNGNRTDGSDPSGLPQETMANETGSYRILDPSSCPLNLD